MRCGAAGEYEPAPNCCGASTSTSTGSTSLSPTSGAFRVPKARCRWAVRAGLSHDSITLLCARKSSRCLKWVTTTSRSSAPPSSHPYMGVTVKGSGTLFSCSCLFSFFVRLELPVSSPRPTLSDRRRAQGLSRTRSSARPRGLVLDRSEHGGSLVGRWGKLGAWVTTISGSASFRATAKRAAEPYIRSARNVSPTIIPHTGEEEA